MVGFGTGNAPSRNQHPRMDIKFNDLGRMHAQIADKVQHYVDEIYSSGDYMESSYTHEFENWLQAMNGFGTFAMTCHSGTQALETIARYRHFPGAKILVPNFTYPATANAFLTTGWDVILCDVDEYGVIDVDAAPTTDFDYVCAVGLYGKALPKDLANLNLIEDGAQHWLADNCDRIAPDTAISFDPTKNLPNYGNGGAIVTDDVDMAKYALAYKSNGRADHTIAGTNSRMTELDAATMLVKTQYLDKWQKRRREIAGYWIDQLGDICMIQKDELSTHALHKFVLCIDDQIVTQHDLISDGIQCKVHYKRPLSHMPAYEMLPATDHVARQLSDSVISLPFYPELTDLEIEYVADTVKKINPAAKPIRKTS